MIKFILLLYLSFGYDFASCSVIQLDLSSYTPFVKDKNIYTQFHNLTDNDNDLELVNISNDVGFLVVQVHSFMHNLTLTQISNNNTLNVTGTNIGLVFGSAGSSTDYSLRKVHNGTVQIMIAVVFYNETAPVPGGCNLTFDNEIAPYQIISYTESLIIVDSQPPSAYGMSCDENKIDVETYQMFLKQDAKHEEGYFSGLISMLSVDDIKKNGKLVTNGYKQSPYRRLFSAYWGTGEVFAIIATHGGESASYVSSVSYACDVNRWNEDCGRVSGYWHVYMPLFLIAGLYLCFSSCFYGCLNISIEILIASFIHESLVVIFMVFFIRDLTSQGLQWMGIIAVLLYIVLSICRCLRNPFSNNYFLFFVTFLTAYFVINSILYSMVVESFPQRILGITGIILYVIGKISTNFYMCFTCSLVGSSMWLTAIDFYFGNTLFLNIFLNFYRLMTVYDFSFSDNTLPTVQPLDIVFLLTWLCVNILGILIQVQKIRNRLRGETPNITEETPDITEETPLLFWTWTNDSIYSKGDKEPIYPWRCD